MSALLAPFLLSRMLTGKSKALGGSSFRDWIETTLGSVLGKVTGSSLTGAEQQANEFSAAEAQKQRDWEQQMSDTANQRAVTDMRAAGLNPALMYGSGSAASTPSGASASSVSPDSGIGFQDLISALSLPVQLRQMQANIANVKAQTNLTKQETENKRIEGEQRQLNLQFDKDLYAARKESQYLANENARTNIKIGQERIKEIAGNIANLAALTDNERLKGYLIQAETNLRNAQEFEVRALLPYKQALSQAQTEQSRAAASLSVVNAAIQQGLLDGGYVDLQLEQLEHQISNLEASEDYVRIQADLMDIRKKIQSGQAINTEDIPDWMITNKFASELWNKFIQRAYELSQALTGPLAGMLK